MKDRSLHSFHNDEKFKCYHHVLGNLGFEAENSLAEAAERIGRLKGKMQPLSHL